jgi:nitroreductase
MSTLRAVRRLKPDAIPDEVLRRVLQAAVWAPSGGNVQPFRIICVADADKKQAIKGWYHEEWHRYTLGNRKALNKLSDEVKEKTARMLSAGDYLANHMGEAPLLLIFCFNPAAMAITDAGLNRPSIVGGGSVYTAVQNLMLACRAEGLGCVLTTLLCYKEEEIKELLNIPSDWGTCACIPIGYPVLKGHGPVSRKPIGKMVYQDNWGANLPAPC